MKVPTVLSLITTSLVLFLISCSTSQTTVQDSVPDLSYQEVPMPEDLISDEFPRPDTWAKYPGGRPILARTIQLQTKIPEQARRAGYAGRAIITYVVNEDGYAGEVEAVMSPHESIAEMYEEVIENLERWEPAILNGESVPQKYMIVTTFQDGNSEEDN